MKKIFIKIIFFLLLINLFTFNFVLAEDSTSLLGERAETSEDGKKGTAIFSTGCIEKGDCELNDFIVLLVRAAQFLLGIVGAVVLLMFVYGGFLFIVSSGNSETIGKAKKIIINSVIGLIIVLTSYLIVQFTLDSIGVLENENKIRESNGENWQDTPK